MVQYFLSRLTQAVVVLLFASMVIFVAVRLAPGDPALARIGPFNVDPNNPHQLADIRHAMGLDRPIYVQYLIWLGDTLHGDLGKSLRNSAPVMNLVLGRVPLTLELIAACLLLSVPAAMFLGSVAAVRQDRWLDHLVNAVTTAGLAVPSFWLGLLLILLFAVRWHLLPASGSVDENSTVMDHLRLLAMPAVTLAVIETAILTRYVRAGMIEILQQPYIRTAYAKGLSPFKVVFRHALRNNLITLVSVIGLEFGILLGNTVIVEQIFGWSGLSWLAVQAIYTADYPVIEAIVLLIAGGFILMNLAVDVAYSLIDPRIRLRSAPDRS